MASALASSSGVPNEFLCPISHSIMKNPVSLQCGHTFDQEGLDNWLKINKVCPTCRKDITEKITVNWSLKSLIDRATNQSQNILPMPLQSENSLITDVDNVQIDERESIETQLSKITASVYRKDSHTNLCLTMPEFKYVRHPVSFVCVIDISGSMGSIVGGGEGGKAFTRLDLVKHVLNVLIASLESTDQLALITFSDNTETVLELVSMTNDNKLLAKNHIKQMEQQSSTITGPAIKRAYEIIANAPSENLKSIILLTDGQDTQGKDMLFRIFDKIEKNSSVQFNTFGFSNDIWSDVLEQLALKGNGIFGFIPDQSMIGTIFVNFMANVFQIFSQEVVVKLSEGFEFDDQEGKDEKKIQLKYGSSRNFLIKKNASIFNLLKEKKSELKVKLGISKQEIPMIELTPNEVIDEINFNKQMARHEILKLVFNPKLPDVKLKDTENSIYVKTVQDFASEFNQPSNEAKSDNNEQIKLSVKNWNTWGQHYIRSFEFAHLFEQCLNFKSPSMKTYRSAKFDEIVDRLTDIFCTLPLPTPSGIDYAKNLPTVTTNRIMDYDAGCILESCKVKLQNGFIKMLKDLNRNDVLEDGSRLVCLIKSKYSGNLIKLNDLIITPYHPILFEGIWQFPIDIYADNLKKSLPNPFYSLIQNTKSVNVCNIVLEKNHVIEIENFQVVTLGHGFEENVVKHPYYGTNRVIEDLAKIKGWDNGLIVLNKYRVIRDENMLVSGMLLEVN